MIFFFFEIGEVLFVVVEVVLLEGVFFDVFFFLLDLLFCEVLDLLEVVLVVFVVRVFLLVGLFSVLLDLEVFGDLFIIVLLFVDLLKEDEVFFEVVLEIFDFLWMGVGLE